MKNFLLGILLAAFGIAVVAVGAVIGAFFLWLAWGGVMDEFFPRLASVGVPMQITLWQAWKLLFFLGVISSPFRASAKSKDE